MVPTPWEFRNRLLAILSSAKHGGHPYVDIDSGIVYRELSGEIEPKHGIPMCNEIMRKLMRPGDAILKDTKDDERATVMIRYLLKAKIDG